ncbi:hypothetical protein ACWKSP_25535 [Micromonosporaceae bacterium Da 78-11]
MTEPDAAGALTPAQPVVDLARLTGVMIRRTLVVLFLLLGSVVAAPGSAAWACSCAKGDVTAMAELAFTGVVRKVDRAGNSLRVLFAVESVQRGSGGASVELRTARDSAACGFAFVEGERYRVFAAAGETSLCSGSERLTFTAGEPAKEPDYATGIRFRPAVLWWSAGVAGLGLIRSA